MNNKILSLPASLREFHPEGLQPRLRFAIAGGTAPAVPSRRFERIALDAAHASGRQVQGIEGLADPRGCRGAARAGRALEGGARGDDVPRAKQRVAAPG